jgi:hypothetical protein
MCIKYEKSVLKAVVNLKKIVFSRPRITDPILAVLDAAAACCCCCLLLLLQRSRGNAADARLLADSNRPLHRQMRLFQARLPLFRARTRLLHLSRRVCRRLSLHPERCCCCRCCRQQLDPKCGGQSFRPSPPPLLQPAVSRKLLLS